MSEFTSTEVVYGIADTAVTVVPVATANQLAGHPRERRCGEARLDQFPCPGGVLGVWNSREFQAAGQRRPLGNAAITVYEQHGVLDARIFLLLTW